MVNLLKFIHAKLPKLWLMILVFMTKLAKNMDISVNCHMQKLSYYSIANK